MKVHWHLGYSKKTACGILSYPTDVPGEFDTADNWRIDCADQPKRVTCKTCRKVMMLDRDFSAAIHSTATQDVPGNRA